MNTYKNTETNNTYKTTIFVNNFLHANHPVPNGIYTDEDNKYYIIEDEISYRGDVFLLDDGSIKVIAAHDDAPENAKLIG